MRTGVTVASLVVVPSGGIDGVRAIDARISAGSFQESLKRRRGAAAADIAPDVTSHHSIDATVGFADVVHPIAVQVLEELHGYDLTAGDGAQAGSVDG